MREIAPGLFHWTAYHDGIDAEVSSYYVAPMGVLVDPMVPEGGLDAFPGDVAPQQVALTTARHVRDTDRFVEAFGCQVQLPRGAGALLGRWPQTDMYHDHEEFAPGLRGVHVGGVSDDEHAIYVTATPEYAIAVGDVLRHYGDSVAFPPDDAMGDDPPAVKAGLRTQFESLLARDFEHLLFAHGDPIVRRGKAALRAFVESPAGYPEWGQMA